MRISYAAMLSVVALNIWVNLRFERLLHERDPYLWEEVHGLTVGNDRGSRYRAERILIRRMDTSTDAVLRRYFRFTRVARAAFLACWLLLALDFFLWR